MQIIGTAVAGSRVTVRHGGHPYDGQIVTVGSSNGQVGGIAGGGAVRVTFTDGATGTVSRYTRVV